MREERWWDGVAFPWDSPPGWAETEAGKPGGPGPAWPGWEWIAAVLFGLLMVLRWMLTTGGWGS